MAHLARLYKLGHGSNGVLDRRVGIDPVLVVQVDHVHLQSAQRSFAGRAHIVRLSIDSDESAIGRPDIAKLRRKDDLVSTILDGFANKFLVLTQTVNVGGVQESDAKLDGAVNCGDRLVLLAIAIKVAHAHAAKPERRDEKSRPTEFTLFHELHHI